MFEIQLARFRKHQRKLGMVKKEAKNNVPHLDTEKKRKMDNKNRNTIGNNQIYDLP